MVKSKSFFARVVGVHILLLAFLFFVIYPLLYVISISFRSGQTLVDPVNLLIPSSPTMEHWALALENNYTGMNPLKKDLDGVEVVELNNGLGDLTFYADGRWSLQADTEFSEEDFPITSYLAISFLNQVGDKIIIEGADKRGFYDYQKIVLDLEENRDQYSSDVHFTTPEGSINGQLDVPSLPEGATRTTLQYGDAYVAVPKFPVLSWLMNTVKVASITGFLILLFSTTGAYAFGV
ncbi:hypothetical protein QWZ13_00100 [Reinekea marina]|uniref:hypothetical protein n=1 Tax=Reinekea marina TaxID=1310421 RepID=UPI0025B4AE08|nr:hypothetical protein [Reinekea marina]MDN3647302.1 hypothetical protein [Reinekea marina]